MGNGTEGQMKRRIKRSVSDIREGALDLHSAGLNDAAVKYLCSKSIIHIISLDLCFNQISSHGMASLSEMRWLNITKVNLISNRIGSMGCKYVVRAAWRFLQKLSKRTYKDENEIGDAGLEHLVRGKWIFLQRMKLRNKLTGEGVGRLKGGCWVRLVYLCLSQNPLDSSGKCKLVLLESSIVECLLLGFSHTIPGSERQKLEENRLRALLCQRFIHRSSKIFG